MSLAGEQAPLLSRQRCCCFHAHNRFICLLSLCAEVRRTERHAPAHLFDYPLPLCAVAFSPRLVRRQPASQATKQQQQQRRLDSSHFSTMCTMLNGASLLPSPRRALESILLLGSPYRIQRELVSETTIIQCSLYKQHGRQRGQIDPRSRLSGCMKLYLILAYSRMSINWFPICRQRE